MITEKRLKNRLPLLVNKSVREELLMKNNVVPSLKFIPAFTFCSTCAGKAVSGIYSAQVHFAVYDTITGENFPIAPDFDKL